MDMQRQHGAPDLRMINYFGTTARVQLTLPSLKSRIRIPCPAPGKPRKSGAFFSDTFKTPARSRRGRTRWAYHLGFPSLVHQLDHRQSWCLALARIHGCVNGLRALREPACARRTRSSTPARLARFSMVLRKLCGDTGVMPARFTISRSGLLRHEPQRNHVARRSGNRAAA